MRKFFIFGLLVVAAGYFCSRTSSEKMLKYAEKHRGGFWAPKLEYYVGMYCYFRRDYRGAIDGFRQVVALHPASSCALEAQYKLARSYDRLNDIESGVEEYEKFLEKYPDHERAGLVKEARFRLERRR